MSAFTLVELIVVIVIIGILAAIAAVAYNFFIDRTNQSATDSGAVQIGKLLSGESALKQVDMNSYQDITAYPQALLDDINASLTDNVANVSVYPIGAPAQFALAGTTPASADEGDLTVCNSDFSYCVSGTLPTLPGQTVSFDTFLASAGNNNAGNNNGGNNNGGNNNGGNAQTPDQIAATVAGLIQAESALYQVIYEDFVYPYDATNNPVGPNPPAGSSGVSYQGYTLDWADGDLGWFIATDAGVKQSAVNNWVSSVPDSVQKITGDYDGYWEVDGELPNGTSYSCELYFEYDEIGTPVDGPYCTSTGGGNTGGGNTGGGSTLTVADCTPDVLGTLMFDYGNGSSPSDEAQEVAQCLTYAVAQLMREESQNAGQPYFDFYQPYDPVANPVGGISAGTSTALFVDQSWRGDDYNDPSSFTDRIEAPRFWNEGLQSADIAAIFVSEGAVSGETELGVGVASLTPDSAGFPGGLNYGLFCTVDFDSTGVGTPTVQQNLSDISCTRDDRFEVLL